MKPTGAKFVLDPIVGVNDVFHNNFFFGAHLINDKSEGRLPTKVKPGKYKPVKNDGRVKFNAEFADIGVITKNLIRKNSEIFIEYNRGEIPNNK